MSRREVALLAAYLLGLAALFGVAYLYLSGTA
jgi:hypothetical protein